jgi:hypothetical protein
MPRRRTQLDRSPCLGSAARPGLGLWRLGEQGDVDVDELTAGGVGQRGADDDVDVVDGLGGQRGAGESAVGEQIGVELVEMIGRAAGAAVRRPGTGLLTRVP